MPCKGRTPRNINIVSETLKYNIQKRKKEKEEINLFKSKKDHLDLRAWMHAGGRGEGWVREKEKKKNRIKKGTNITSPFAARCM